MGIFGRKGKDEQTSSPSGPWDVEPEEGVVFLGSIGTDNDAETDVQGEAQYRDTLLRCIRFEQERGESLERGRVEHTFELATDGDKVMVTSALSPVGYLDASVTPMWLPRVKAWEAQDVTILCAGVVLWNPKLGNPLESDDVPIGVRLDLVDQS
jgi:hypothetical protein